MSDSIASGIFREIFFQSPLGCALVNPSERFELVNPAWSKLFGYNQDEAKSISLQDTLQGEIINQLSQLCSDLRNLKLVSFQKLVRYQHKDGSTFWSNLSLSALHFGENPQPYLLATFQDVENLLQDSSGIRDLNLNLDVVSDSLIEAQRAIQEKNSELRTAFEKLEELVRTDPLTGLPNRRALEENLQHEADRTARTGTEFSICLADIDDFKKINDNYGHDIGDIVLKDVAEIFKHSIRGIDIVGRWGGEEFLFILPETPRHGAMILMERVRLYIMNHFVHKGNVRFAVTVTIGFSSFQKDSHLDDIIKQADLALYAGKKTGKNLAIAYTPNLEIVHSIQPKS